MKFGLWSVLFFSLFFFACDDRCDDTECFVFPNWNFSFIPLDANREPLLIMPDSVYSKDSISIFPDTVGIEMSFQIDEVNISVPRLPTTNAITEFIVNWSRKKIDTFKIDYTMGEMDCCGTVFKTVTLSNQDSIINISPSHPIQVLVP